MLHQSDFNLKLVSKVIGNLLIIESALILLMISISLIYGEYDQIPDFLLSAGPAFFVGAAMRLFGRKSPERVGKREGAMIVALTWVFYSLFGALPYWFSGSIPSYTDAYFETISGFTTTGASILNNIEELSYGILFWRSTTHWIGGLGIVVISLALLPLFNVSGTQLFAAEATGPTKDKIHPKIAETAKRLFYIYLAMTVVEAILLYFGGMTIFDAVCHAFATISTGGFSTKQASVAYWSSPFIQYTIIVFMILAGVNFSLFYFSAMRQSKKMLNNEEFRYYLIVIFGVSVLLFGLQIDFNSFHIGSDMEKLWRDTLFTVASLTSSTGFGTADYTLWKPVTWVFLLGLMVIGGSAGSTAGGAKVIRVVISLKTSYYQFKQMIHPTAIIPVKYNHRVVSNDILTRILAFMLLYTIVIFFGTVVLLMLDMPLLEAVGGTFSMVGCTGPALGTLGPAGNYSGLSDLIKWFLTFLMLIGRLELYTVLIIFSPAFWKSA